MKSWILFLLLCIAPLCSGADADPLYIVVLQPAKAGAPAFDVAKHGGTLEHRAGSRLAVRLPEAAVGEVKQDPLVRYVQQVVAGEAARPAMPTHDRLAAQASVRTNSVTSVTHGPFTYDGAGNVRAIGPSSQPNQVYSYDRVGRLATARMYSGGTLYQQSFTYDAPGNMTSVTLDGLVTSLPVQGNTNRLAAASGFTYDATGNMTASPMSGSYTYDQLGMLKADASTPYTNVFTPSDERLAVITTSGSPRWRWTLRDLSNQRVRDFESFGPTGTEYFEWLEDTCHDGAQVMATIRDTAEGGTRHFHLDHLGTPRLTTNEEGREISRHDQLPYGVELTSLRQERDRGYTREQIPRFTGHERDYLELTSADDHKVYLDYMHARTYNPNWGRFVSVDPKTNSAKPAMPQTWNRYAYALNNPLKYVDPNGEEVFIVVTNVVVDDTHVNSRRGGAGVRETVPAYKIVMMNEAGDVALFAGSRDTNYAGKTIDTRGEYGSNHEAPPGSYFGKLRGDGKLGPRVELSDTRTGSSIMAPDGTKRDHVQIHVGPGCSRGCVLLTGGKANRNAFINSLKYLQEQERAAGRSDQIRVVVQSRNKQECSNDRCELTPK